ncbi:hypothetical protein BB560_004687 [Smittium megazygosporum]|uniref:beta-N-acetylhexosaminidase n=1 Tax=Smittium megazygosporum TaxID=133381 RepID=A0A2T9Z8P7_9FUNG|nr:hypothetical protein BB560_004687 [Smittium megazygosporum]
MKISILAVSSLLVTLSNATPSPAGSYGIFKKDDSVYANPNDCDSDIESLIAGMTLEQKITQKLLPDIRNWNYGGCNNTAAPLQDMNDEVALSLAKYSFGGLTLFAENLYTTERSVRLIDNAQKANAINNKIPLLVCIDQEGGIVTRLGNGIMMPGNMAIGATSNTDYAYRTGLIVGKEVRAVGANLDFAPDSDVNVNPANPVIGVRSFGMKPELVSANVVRYLDGLRESNCIGCVKHFPGHGDTATDSHFGLPLVNKTLDRINSIELVPFKAAIAAGVDMIMTAHIQYPALDNSTIPSIIDGEPILKPATLSRAIMTDFLRGQLGFKGVTVTDAMNMDAIVKYVGQIDATAKAISAGVDLIIMPVLVRCVSNFTLYDQVIDAVKNEISEGRYSVAELESSVRRILTLKKKYNLLQLDNSPIEERIKYANATLSDPADKAIEKQIAEEAITVVKNDPTYGIPFNTDENSNVVVFMPDDTQTAAVRRKVGELKIKGNFNYMNFTRRALNGTAEELANKASHIILGSLVTTNTPAIDGGDIFINPGDIGTWAYSFPAAVVEKAKEKKISVAVVSLRNPYDVANFENAVGAVLCAYGYKGIILDVYAQPNLPAAISTIFGQSKPKGRLPVDIPSVFKNDTILYPFGFGLSL